MGSGRPLADRPLSSISLGDLGEGLWRPIRILDRQHLSEPGEVGVQTRFRQMRQSVSDRIVPSFTSNPPSIPGLGDRYCMPPL